VPIITDISNYFKERRLLKLRGDLELIAKSDFAYNPYKLMLPDSLRDKNEVSKTMLESLVWYSGKTQALIEYYTRSLNEADHREDFFWRTASNFPTTRKIHSGLPQLISKTMSKLLFGNGLKIVPTVYNDNQEIDTVQTDLTKEAINIIAKETDLMQKLATGAITESWSGHIAYKLSFNVMLSPYPIIESYDPRYFDIIKLRGVLIGIVFKKYIETGGGQSLRRYVLKEFYTTNDDGDAIINYSLHQVAADGRETEVSLQTLEQTKDLFENPTITFTGLKGMLAFEKPNVMESSVFVDSPFGQSDYDVAFSLFDGLDEIISGIVEEIRTNKTMRYIPEDFIPRDQAGNFNRLNNYVTNFIKYKSDIDQDSKSKIETTSIPDKTMEHYEKWRILIQNVCNACGLSPVSLGIDGLVSISSSDKTLQEKNRTSLETRATKIELWKPFVEKMILTILELTSYIQAQYPQTIPAGFPVINVKWSNAEIAVQFNDYLVNSIEDRISTWSQAKAGGVASIETIVDQIWGDEFSQEDKDSEVNRIKIETGVPLDDPSMLNLTEDIPVPATNQELMAIGMSIENYGNANIPQSEDAYGKFMYYAELIKNGNLATFRKDLPLLDARYQPIIAELTAQLPR
jgi:A118 family predicted phage portal protein